jgi:hypothetical protein
MVHYQISSNTLCFPVAAILSGGISWINNDSKEKEKMENKKYEL